MDPMDKLSSLLKKDLPGSREMLEQVTPLLEAMIEQYADELDEKMFDLHRRQMQLVTNIYAISTLLQDKGICTDQEIQETYKKCAEKIEKGIREREEKTSDIHLKI